MSTLSAILYFRNNLRTSLNYKICEMDATFWLAFTEIEKNNMADIIGINER